MKFNRQLGSQYAVDGALPLTMDPPSSAQLRENLANAYSMGERFTNLVKAAGKDPVRTNLHSRDMSAALYITKIYGLTSVLAFMVTNLFNNSR